MSFGCPHCDALCGEFFLPEIFLEAKYHEDKAPAILEKELILDPVAEGTYEHWCFSDNGEFCHLDNPPHFE